MEADKCSCQNLLHVCACSADLQELHMQACSSRIVALHQT